MCLTRLTALASKLRLIWLGDRAEEAEREVAGDMQKNREKSCYFAMGDVWSMLVRDRIQELVPRCEWLLFGGDAT